jgi:folate-dependent phosphoribosylglycinamide formyltransferase PurN
MMHLVTPELDSGPVITYCTYPITGKPFDNHWRELKGRSVIEIKKNEGEKNALFQLIRQHGLSREFPLIISTLKAFGDGEVKIETGRLIARDGKPISGFDLTDEVNKAVEMP